MMGKVHKACLVLISCNHNLGVPASHRQRGNCLGLSGLGPLIQKDMCEKAMWKEFCQVKGRQASGDDQEIAAISI